MSFGFIDNVLQSDSSHWDAAFNDKINSASFNAANGILTLVQQDSDTVEVDLDGRYLSSGTVDGGSF